MAVLVKRDVAYKKIRLKPKIRESIIGYLFLLPALIFFGIFVLFPMIQGIYISFYDYTMSKFEFIGLQNYFNLFTDKVFMKSLWNTLLIVIGTVPVIVVFCVYVSNAIYERSAFTRSFFRGVFYLPVVTGIVSVTVVWQWIFHPLHGILNYLLQSMNLVNAPISFLGDSRFALISVMVVLLTTSVGQPIILYVASLGNIPKDYKEAAQIDGANNWQIFKHIKWPLLMPTTLYIVVISTINSFQCFSLIQLLTAGGPNYSTSTIMYLVYERSFVLNKYGYSAAMGVLLAVVIALFSLVQYKFFGKDVEY
ncbi:MAG: carbohydrate ABC transporter permease [Turicibacter sp.]